MSVAVMGSGAFGTALAIALGQTQQVTLWSRDEQHAHDMMRHRVNARRLPDRPFPEGLRPTHQIEDLANAETVLMAVPTQLLRGFLTSWRADLSGKTLVACCKGIEIESGMGPVAVAQSVLPDAPCALLTGPSFASDIAAGLPTALTLACADGATGKTLQNSLSTGTLRLYRTTDTVGAELGGALKNVIAIACGTAMGAGLGESARAAVMTRGFAEMNRLAIQLGSKPTTLAGLSGFGDLTLTCTSEQSRNYRLGLSLGKRTPFSDDITVEGASTACAVAALAQQLNVEMPITQAVAALVENRLDVQTAMDTLLARPLKEE
jgi:glycerol-3-phosphate dehydrogenase (NAD(P)+)